MKRLSRKLQKSGLDGELVSKPSFYKQQAETLRGGVDDAGSPRKLVAEWREDARCPRDLSHALSTWQLFPQEGNYLEQSYLFALTLEDFGLRS